MCAPQNHPNYPSYHLQNQEGWSTETHFFEMEPGPTASKKETITPSSTIPYLKAIQISARSEPISPSYDPNEFVHFYNKKSHQKIMTFITIFLSLFFRILVFFFEKLRNTSTLSTNPKKKLKNSLIQPRTSRSNFGKISLNFEKIGPGGGPEALRYGWILRKHLKKPQLWTHEKIFVILNNFFKVKNNTRKIHEICFDFFSKTTHFKALRRGQLLASPAVAKCHGQNLEVFGKFADLRQVLAI